MSGKVINFRASLITSCLFSNFPLLLMKSARKGVCRGGAYLHKEFSLGIQAFI